MHVYLDVCAIQRPLDDQSQLRIATETEAIVRILELCEVGELTLMRSAAHGIETRANPITERQEHVRDVLSLASHELPITSEVTDLATSYSEGRIKRLDAMHLALAVVGGADYFCTTDDQFLRRGRDVDTKETLVVSPSELVEQIDQPAD